MPKFLTSIILLFSAIGHAAPERILWNKPHWPPYYIAEGPKAGQGHVDRLLQLVEKQNSWKFESVLSELDQLEFRRRGQHHSCNGAVLRTKEREQTAYFTAFYLQPPVQLIVRTEDWKKSLYEVKVTSLKQLLETSPLKGAFAVGRSYGEPLDVFIKKQTKNPKITFAQRSESLSLVTMVSVGRVDYTLEYPEVIKFMQQEKQLSKDLTTIEIEEQREPYVVYISCPKDEWGKATITKLDQAVKKAAATADYKSLMEEWYPADIRARYRREFDEFYKKRSSENWTTVPIHKF